MKNIAFYFFLAIFFTSCFRDRIDIDNNTGENKKLAITAWLTTDDRPQNVFITYTINYLDNDVPEDVGNAVVTISNGQTTYTLEEERIGKYTLNEDWNPTVGETYTLKVLVDGTEYVASQELKLCPEIEALTYEKMELNEEEETPVQRHSLWFNMQEVPGEGDGYYGVAYKKGWTGRDKILGGSIVDDSFQDGVYFEDIEMQDVEGGFVVGDTAVIEIQSFGIDASNYITTILDEVYRDELFGGPPANIESNFDGGAIGFFIIADVRTQEIIIEN